MPISVLSPRLEDPALDVMRRAIMQYLKDGNDPRVLPSVAESSIEQHDDYGKGLWYVVLRSRHGMPPLKVYRLLDDANKSLRGLDRFPHAIRDEYEATSAEIAQLRKKAAHA